MVLIGATSMGCGRRLPRNPRSRNPRRNPSGSGPAHAVDGARPARPNNAGSAWFLRAHLVSLGLLHVLDLAFILPALIAAGVLLLRRHPAGGVLAVVVLVKMLTRASRCCS